MVQKTINNVIILVHSKFLYTVQFWKFDLVSIKNYLKFCGIKFYVN